MPIQGPVRAVGVLSAKVAPPSLTVRGVGRQSVFVMNVALAAATLSAPTTYELCLFPSLVTPTAAPVPANTFVTKAAAALAKHFGLDAGELELAELLLYGRTIGAIARVLGVGSREVQTRCAALFATTESGCRREPAATSVPGSSSASMSRPVWPRCVERSASVYTTTWPGRRSRVTS